MMKEKGDGAESGSGDCRTSNKIILTTRLNYTRGTNNNIWPARIPAINIEPGGDRPLRPSWPVSIHRSFPNPRLHGLPRRLTSTMQSKTMGPGCGPMEGARRGVGWGGERQGGGGERACEKRGLTPARGSQLPARGWRETWESRSNRVVTGNRFRSDEIYSS